MDMSSHVAKASCMQESGQVKRINELAQPVPIKLRQNPRAFYLNGDEAIQTDSVVGAGAMQP
jgi:hypothetical protein